LLPLQVNGIEMAADLQHVHLSARFTDNRDGYFLGSEPPGESLHLQTLAELWNRLESVQQL